MLHIEQLGDVDGFLCPNCCSNEKGDRCCSVSIVWKLAKVSQDYVFSPLNVVHNKVPVAVSFHVSLQEKQST